MPEEKEDSAVAEVVAGEQTAFGTVKEVTPDTRPAEEAEPEAAKSDERGQKSEEVAEEEETPKGVTLDDLTAMLPAKYKGDFKKWIQSGDEREREFAKRSEEFSALKNELDDFRKRYEEATKTPAAKTLLDLSDEELTAAILDNPAPTMRKLIELAEARAVESMRRNAAAKEAKQQEIIAATCKYHEGESKYLYGHYPDEDWENESLLKAMRNEVAKANAVGDFITGETAYHRAKSALPRAVKSPKIAGSSTKPETKPELTGEAKELRERLEGYRQKAQTPFGRIR